MAFLSEVSRAIGGLFKRLPESGGTRKRDKDLSDVPRTNDQFAGSKTEAQILPIPERRGPGGGGPTQPPLAPAAIPGAIAPQPQFLTGEGLAGYTDMSTEEIDRRLQLADNAFFTTYGFRPPESTPLTIATNPNIKEGSISTLFSPSAGIASRDLGDTARGRGLAAVPPPQNWGESFLQTVLGLGTAPALLLPLMQENRRMFKEGQITKSDYAQNLVGMVPIAGQAQHLGGGILGAIRGESDILQDPFAYAADVAILGGVLYKSGALKGITEGIKYKKVTVPSEQVFNHFSGAAEVDPMVARILKGIPQEEISTVAKAAQKGVGFDAVVKRWQGQPWFQGLKEDILNSSVYQKAAEETGGIRFGKDKPKGPRSDIIKAEGPVKARGQGPFVAGPEGQVARPGVGFSVEAPGAKLLAETPEGQAALPEGQVAPALPVTTALSRKALTPGRRLSIGDVEPEPGVQSFKSTPLSPEKVQEAGNFLVAAARSVGNGLLNVFEPAKPVQRKLGEDIYGRVIRGIHEHEASILDFNNQELKILDANFGELREFFSQFPAEINRDFMLSRGTALSEGGGEVQVGARERQAGVFSKEQGTQPLEQAYKEITDYNFELARGIEDINYMEDYFFGTYKNTGKVTRFLNHWKTTKKWKEHKVIATPADAVAWGLELKDNNPVTNALQENIAIARVRGMQDLRTATEQSGVVMRESEAPSDWVEIQDPVFKGSLADPALAKMVNSLISANKVSRSPAGNTIRKLNNFLRQVKFMGSAFHLQVEAKQAIADSGVTEILQGKPLGQIFKKGFTTDAPEFKTPEYRDFISRGGGHRYSIESQAQQSMKGTIKWMMSQEGPGHLLKIPGAAALPFSKFIDWQFESYIPKLKYAKYLQEVAKKEKVLGRPVTDAEGAEIIKEGQNFYGEMNERLFGRSGTVTSVMRFFFNAPGFAEGNFRTIGKGAVQRKAARSRRNMYQSLLLTAMYATIGTLILTGESPDVPENTRDVRDLFKIKTGQKDDKDRDIYIDLLTYDKDYYEVAMKALLGRPGESFEHAMGRAGGMKTTSIDIAADLVKITQGQVIHDYKGDPVFDKTDPVSTKTSKYLAYAKTRAEPIPESVFRQARDKDVSLGSALGQAVTGTRPTFSAEQVEKNQKLSRFFDLVGKKERLNREMATLDNPAKEIKKYNALIEEYLGNLEDVDMGTIEVLGEDLFVDEDKFIRNKLKKAFTMSREETLERETERIGAFQQMGLKRETDKQKAKRILRSFGKKHLYKPLEEPFNTLEDEQALWKKELRDATSDEKFEERPLWRRSIRPEIVSLTRQGGEAGEGWKKFLVEWDERNRDIEEDEISPDGDSFPKNQWDREIGDIEEKYPDFSMQYTALPKTLLLR